MSEGDRRGCRRCRRKRSALLQLRSWRAMKKNRRGKSKNQGGNMPYTLWLILRFSLSVLFRSFRSVNKTLALETFIREESLCILNTGQHTHFTMPSGRTSTLDLSLASPQLAHVFTWSVHDEGSRSSFILRITYPQSSVTPPLAGPSGRRPPGM